MPIALEPGAWLTVGTIRCLVVEVFNTLPPRSACEVLTRSTPPMVRTAIHDDQGWRFLDMGQPADSRGPMSAWLEKLQAPEH